MKPITHLLLALLLAAGLPAMALPAPYSFDFKVEKKKLEGNRTTTLERTVSTEKWCYTVTIQNQSFKDIAGVNIKYIIYYKVEQEGSKLTSKGDKEKRMNGETNAAMLQNNGNFVFDTNPVQLVRSQLEGGFYYENGGRTRSRDSLTGIWIRLYQGDTMIGEYADPPSLTTGNWDAK